MAYPSDRQAHLYEPISQHRDIEGDGTFESKQSCLGQSPTRSSHIQGCMIKIAIVIAGVVGFALGITFEKLYPLNSISQDVAPRIRLPTIQRAFTYPSPFSKSPPVGKDLGNASEPIWDALIPSTLSVDPVFMISHR
jgi:hypothetical protein